MRYDFIIRNAEVLDGSGNESFTADIAVKDGVIVTVGRIPEDAQADEIIDASGKSLAPGFIDAHSHADLAAARYPGMDNLLVQGITTVFAGQCGMGVAPSVDHSLGMVEDGIRIGPDVQGLIREHYKEHSSRAALTAERQFLDELYARCYGVDKDWGDWAEYEASLIKKGPGANMILLAGHGALRAEVMGLNCDREASAEETERLCSLLDRTMKQGASGLSFGFDYAPGSFAGYDELLKLSQVVADNGGILAAHTQFSPRRGSGTVSGFQPIDGYRELLELGLKTGARIQLSHLRCGYKPVPDPVAGRAYAKAVTDLIDEYRAKGVKAGWDVLPNYTDAGLFEPMLASKFPVFLEECGSLKAFEAVLRTAEGFEKLLSRAEKGEGGGMIPGLPRWEEGYVVRQCAEDSFAGKSIAELASGEGTDPLRFALLLLREDVRTCVSLHMPDGELRGFDWYISRPDVSVGLDVGTSPMNCQLEKRPDMPPVYRGGWADFAGMAYMMCRNRHLSREHLIAAVSGNTALDLGLSDRGFVRPGMKADLVLMDWDILDDNIDYIHPNRGPLGIERVWVNGVLAAAEGKPLAAGAGTILHIDQRQRTSRERNQKWHLLKKE